MRVVQIQRYTQTTQNTNTNANSVILSLKDVEEAIFIHRFNKEMRKGTRRNRIASLNAFMKYIATKSINENRDPYRFVFSEIDAYEFIQHLIVNRQCKIHTIRTYISNIYRGLKTFYIFRHDLDGIEKAEKLRRMFETALNDVTVNLNNRITEIQRARNILDITLDKLRKDLNKTLDFLINERAERGKTLATAIILQFCTASRATEINNIRYFYKERILELEIHKTREDGHVRWKYVPLNDELHILLMNYIGKQTNWHLKSEINDYTVFKDRMKNTNERITVIDTENKSVETITYLFYKDINREFNTEKLRYGSSLKNGTFITPRYVRRVSRGGVLFSPLISENKAELFLYLVGQTTRELEINKTYQNPPLDFINDFRDDILDVQNKLCNVINLKQRLKELI